MRILLINQEHAQFSGPGGAERSVQSIAEHFASVGHQTTFLSMSRRVYTRDMDESGIHSIRDIHGVKTILVGKTGQTPTHSDIILPIVIEEAPDIIHTNVFHRGPQLWSALAPLGIPLLHTLREYKLLCDNNMFNGSTACSTVCKPCAIASGYAKQMSGKVDGVVGLSRFTLDRHLEQGFFANAKLTSVIPNSYRLKDGSATPIAVRHRDKPRIGFLGRMHASKGINLVIDAFRALDPNVASLVMAGDLQDDQIAAKVAELSATHDAAYIGFVDPKVFFRDIDVLLAPSIWHEPFGRITIEAFAHGVPVITTDRGGLPDIVTHSKTGWVFNPDNPENLTKILLEIKDLTEAEFQRLHLACLAAAQRYLPEKVGDLYLNTYQQLIEAKRATTSKTVARLREVYRRDMQRQQALTKMRTNKPIRDRRPLKILVVTGEYPKLSETFVLNHITGLLDLGHDVKVLHTHHGPADQMPNDYLRRRLHERSFSILPDEKERKLIDRVTRPGRIAVSRLATAAGRSDLAPLLKEEIVKAASEMKTVERHMLDLHAAASIEKFAPHVDIVHCHFDHRPKMMFKFMDMGAYRAPIVCSFHGIDMSAHVQERGPGLYDDIKRKLHKALPVSNFFRQRLISLGFDPKDVRVHRVGIDCSKFVYTDRRRSAGETLCLVSVGRLVTKKGFDIGIRAVARVLELNPDMKVSYQIAGEGMKAEKLRHLIGELGLERHVKLIGAQPHEAITALLNQSHLLVAPSLTGPDGDMEGIPTVTMEAMASGLPVLSTFHSGIPEAVVDGVTGFLVPEGDVDGMARYIAHLYNHPGTGSLIGRQGRAHVELEFNIETQNLKLVDLYRRIVGGLED